VRLCARTKHLAFSIAIHFRVPVQPSDKSGASVATVPGHALSSAYNSFHTNTLPIAVTVEVRTKKLLLHSDFIMLKARNSVGRVQRQGWTGGGQRTAEEKGDGREETVAFALLLIYETTTAQSGALPRSIGQEGLVHTHHWSSSDIVGLLRLRGGSVAEWLACCTQAQMGPGSNRSRDAVG